MHTFGSKVEWDDETVFVHGVVQNLEHTASLTDHCGSTGINLNNLRANSTFKRMLVKQLSP